MERKGVRDVKKNQNNLRYIVAVSKLSGNITTPGCSRQKLHFKFSPEGQFAFDISL